MASNNKTLNDAKNPMSELDEVTLDKVRKLEKILEWSVTGAPDYRNLIQAHEDSYTEIRQVLMKDSKLLSLMPDFIKKCRYLNEVNDFIREKYPTYKESRRFIRDGLNPLQDLLEYGKVSMKDGILPDLPTVGFSSLGGELCNTSQRDKDVVDVVISYLFPYERHDVL